MQKYYELLAIVLDPIQKSYFFTKEYHAMVGMPQSSCYLNGKLTYCFSYFMQPDRVTDFCKKNKLQLIIRAHECVMDGFERFAQGQLITLFSATNYCGKYNFSGAF